METRKRLLGEEHPDTLTSMANLAFTWESQSRLDEALALMRRCVESNSMRLAQIIQIRYLMFPHCVGGKQRVAILTVKQSAHRNEGT